MGFDLSIFGDKQISEEYVEWLVDERSVDIYRHFSRLWDYYSNPMIDLSAAASGRVSQSGRCYVQAQEYGLASRITGIRQSAAGGIFAGAVDSQIERKEVVIENDIGWRVDAGVDFLFGKPVSFSCKSPDEAKSAEIEKIIKALFSVNGGIRFFQDMAVLGSVYGFVDCLIRPGGAVIEKFNSISGGKYELSEVLDYVKGIDLELIEAPRALPILEEDDYRRISFYVQHFYQKRNELAGGGGFLSRLCGGRRGDERRSIAVTEIHSSDYWQRYEDNRLVAEGGNPWGFLPVVHIQNIVRPYYYEGHSDVEALIPLQDELNTRLSDRANRITFQAFKMYLGKGIEGFEDKPVSPGQMWCTDNMEASIEEFGGDNDCPSEDVHIDQIREAMDKVSSVTPLVAGVIRDKLGNLTSAVALKLTMMGMLSKTERKQFTYGEGLKRICGMVLDILDKSGIYHTSEADREFDVIFRSPLPENTAEKLEEAKMKKELGVPTEQVLRELGYETERMEDK